MPDRFPERLKQGYSTFRSEAFPRERQRYDVLAADGQKPTIMIIACCDSRAAPEIVFDASPGEVFVVRNVANLVPPCERGGRFHGTSTAVEFAVEHLQVGHIIVLGHAHCGGIRSLFESPGEAGESDSFVPTWMGLVRSAYLRVEGTLPDAPLEEKARICEQSAVLVSLENLMTFPNVRERVADGRLRLHGWHIDIRSCTLQVYDPASQHFEPVD